MKTKVSDNKLGKLFRQRKHPSDMPDEYHIFDIPNALNIVYWYLYQEMVSGLDGDIVEAGVGRGRSLISIAAVYEIFKCRGDKRQIWALDSFEGFPEPTEKDISKRAPQKGEWSMSPNNQFKYSDTNLLKILHLTGFTKEMLGNINIVPGFFNQTTKNLQTEKIAILHLDGDLYESIKIPLLNLAPKIVNGGIVVIDDFEVISTDREADEFPGARLAVNEFLSNNKNFLYKTSIRGTPYLVKL